jgi:hypothetical protein
MRHLLPCPCGQSIRIDTSQAGERVTCGACGQSQDAPTYRAIKALQLDSADVAAAQQRAAQQAGGNWSPMQGVLFAVGLVLLLIGLCGAGYCAYVVRRIDVPPPTAEQFAAFESRFDKLDLVQNYELFLEYKAHGMGPEETPLYVHAKRLEGSFTRVGIGCAILAGVGALLAACSLVVGGKRTATMKR